MENTLENRLKFYAQHLGQNMIIESDCFKSENGNDIIHTQLVSVSLKGIECNNWIPVTEHTALELKPISSMTDEDAKKLGFRDCDHFNFDANPDAWKDELRLLGYAVDWVNLSIEKQIAFGWLKLKTN
ncbi:SAM domain-containing protein [Chryseobacterium indoltheticum]|uniref:Uncharacterized protein n=1 Tax=Chryseobacterium indoltheticum TaxID=254 RepID=A0A381FHN9_9FLAO|nr:hypothetical protein [Chryseobacterium indoltheticum]AZA74762.1 hypothetical protein EG358_13750 [Chryseobacterium indoltheticum]SIQ36237.1 hypothetical protein SAMN05421682_104219 [Chryseobacterium indoltheticum]SUX45978.1 Uncharacterised protein [Chryseobacterium indoltheticum]